MRATAPLPECLAVNDERNRVRETLFDLARNALADWRESCGRPVRSVAW